MKFQAGSALCYIAYEGHVLTILRGSHVCD